MVCITRDITTLPILNVLQRHFNGTCKCCRGNEVDSFMQSHADVNAEPLDIEDLVKLGQLSGPCPYLLSKEMAASAEIVFMPYNYLIDAKNRMGLGKITWEGAVLIFDEAHNLEVPALYSCAACCATRCVSPSHHVCVAQYGTKAA